MGQTTGVAQIAGALTNGLRRTLIDDGRWPEIERRLVADDPELAAWLRTSERAEWVDLEDHILLVERIGALLGIAELRALGRARLRGAIETGPLGPLFRGWIREYGRDPRRLMRVFPHAWAAVTRHAGRLVIARSEPDRLVFRAEGAPLWIAEHEGWVAYLSGFATSLVESAGVQGSVSVGFDESATTIEVVTAWLEV